MLHGGRRLDQMGRSHEGAEGSAFFASDIDNGVLTYEPDGLYVSVFLPTRALLARVPEAETRFMEPIAPDSQALRLLTSYVSALMKSAGGLDPAAAASVADHIVDLCALLVGAEGHQRELAEGRGLREAQRSQIAEAIEAGAATPGFTARTVARKLRLTEREVHDLLWEAGQSYSNLVNERKVEIARQRLGDPRSSGLSIEEIAFLSGFMDLKKFVRAFETRSGDTPSDFRSGRKTPDSRRRHVEKRGWGADGRHVDGVRVEPGPSQRERRGMTP